MNKQLATRVLYNLSTKLREIGKQYESNDDFKELSSTKPNSIGKKALPSSSNRLIPYPAKDPLRMTGT